jgi:hypothetical protein
MSVWLRRLPEVSMRRRHAHPVLALLPHAWLAHSHRHLHCHHVIQVEGVAGPCRFGVQTHPTSERSSLQRVWHPVVLLQVLVLQGGVAVVYGHGQLPLAQQPLFSQVVVNLVLGCSQMIRNAILVHVVWVGDAMCLGSLHSIISYISMAHNIAQQEAAHITRGEGVQGHPATGT